MMSISNAQNSSLFDDCDDLQPPAVSSNSLDFGGVEQGGSQTIQVVISNTNDRPMLWLADTGEAIWLTLDANTGVLQPGEEQAINVTVDTSLMVVGEYTATLTFTAEADDCSASVSVQMILAVIPSITPPTQPVQPPAVGVSFGGLRSGSIGILQQVISNPDSRPVNWFGDTGGAEWLILDPNSGMLQPGEAQTISLLADTRLLKGVGMHSALLTFVSQVTEPEIASSVSTPKERESELEALTTASEGSIAMSQSVQVPVIADLTGVPDRISGPKAPSANTASLNFNASSMSKSLVITNIDTQTVHWTVTTAFAAGGSSWLTLSSTSGDLLSTKSATLTVKASTSSLAPGSYSALLTFNSEIISSGVAVWSNPGTTVLVTLTV